MKANVKITVLRRTLNKDAIAAYAEPPDWGPCERFEEGQEFVTDDINMPAGFCSWAWADIQKHVLVLARGGSFLGTAPGVFVTCCTDGYRPVIFKLERMA